MARTFGAVHWSLLLYFGGQFWVLFQLKSCVPRNDHKGAEEVGLASATSAKRASSLFRRPSPRLLYSPFLTCRITTLSVRFVPKGAHIPRIQVRSPSLHLLAEKLAQFDRERIPERVVHARGASAKGFFEVRARIRSVGPARPDPPLCPSR